MVASFVAIMSRVRTRGHRQVLNLSAAAYTEIVAARRQQQLLQAGSRPPDFRLARLGGGDVTLAEIAAEVRCSPVYLTQVFQQVEGLPLYRYQLRLRLARALDLLAHYDDLTTLSLDLGFSSHSHFSAAFREAYGRSPSEFRQSALRR